MTTRVFEEGGEAAKARHGAASGTEIPACWAEDVALAARCRAGDERAARQLIEQYHDDLRATLIRLGASETWAEDLLANLWGDCCGVGADHPGRLARYDGRSSLKTWFARVLKNRLFDRFRRDREREFPEFMRDGEALAGKEPPAPESALTRLLRAALVEAFKPCDAETLVMLQLVYLHAFSQREIAAAWGVSEFKISRRLTKAVGQIRDTALAYLNKHDPLLRLTWDDFVELCANSELPRLWAHVGGNVTHEVQT